MGKNTCYVYGLYENDELKFTGTRLDIIREFDLREEFNLTSYTNAQTKHKFRKKYDVKIIGSRPSEKLKVKNKVPKETEAEIRKRESLESNLMTMKLYGNAMTIKEYLNDAVKCLKENGYEVKIRELEGLNDTRGRKSKPCYILERV